MLPTRPFLIALAPYLVEYDHVWLEIGQGFLAQGAKIVPGSISIVL